ncbi:DUF6207 family protein [Streptomyces mirabilis]|uniref:DUF6207 family protein n=1 Tax=Streptomyces mirabilis TaxID=68239 RepID=UPI0036D791E8
MKITPQRNSSERADVMAYMDPINENHVGERGLIVLDVAAADDATAFAFQQSLANRWATATAQQTTRDAGEPGVRLRCHVDLRQKLASCACASTD